MADDSVAATRPMPPVGQAGRDGGRSVAVTRTEHRLLPDARRVLAKPYSPGEEVFPSGPSRARLLMDRIVSIPEVEVDSLFAEVIARFSARHRAFEEILERHFRLVAHHVQNPESLSRVRRLLIGAYFTHEFAVEAAALFNPSIVPAPNQDHLAPGELRFVMSLRAVGDGHLSSIEFRSGVVGSDGTVRFDPLSPYLVAGSRTEPAYYDKKLFSAKLVEIGVGNEIARRVLDPLPDAFTHAALDASLTWFEAHGPPPAIWYETVKIIRVLASSNYVTTFDAGSSLAERVIFPAGPNETRGMEDARFVQFTDDRGNKKYYATYTAYDGFEILPQLIETDDFVTFTVSTMNGAAAQNKGMALFPRPIDGQYVMLSRKDRENLHLATSQNVRFWNDVTELYRPSSSWELLQTGNSGSPIETDAGWLVLTHGAGPMRRYALGALLLDLRDPRKVIGKLKEPLLEPEETEREGYVPNVVYSCGGLVHEKTLVLPYGFSDLGIGIATVSLPSLIEKLCAAGA